MTKKKVALLAAFLAVSGFGIGAFGAGYVYPLIQWAINGTGSRINTVEFQVQTPSAGAAAVLIPGTDNANALGSSTKRFSNIFTNLLTVSGTQTNNGPVINNGTETNNSNQVFGPLAVQSVQWSTQTITASAVYERIGSTGTITLTGTPTISTTSATDGQFMILDSTAAVITIQDQATLANSGLCLSAATITITTSTPVAFIYNGITGANCWKQIK